MILGSLGFHLCVSRWSLQLTLASAFWCCWVFSVLFSVGELNFDLFLASSNNLTATVECNAASEKKKTKIFEPNGDLFYTFDYKKCQQALLRYAFL